jgi:prevent-host-death family protein
MAKTVNLYEAKTRLSQLVEQVARGEEIVSAKAGRPRAVLVPTLTAGQPRGTRPARGAGARMGP